MGFFIEVVGGFILALIVGFVLAPMVTFYIMSTLFYIFRKIGNIGSLEGERPPEPDVDWYEVYKQKYKWLN